MAERTGKIRTVAASEPGGSGEWLTPTGKVVLAMAVALVGGGSFAFTMAAKLEARAEAIATAQTKPIADALEEHKRNEKEALAAILAQFTTANKEQADDIKGMVKDVQTIKTDVAVLRSKNRDR